MATTERILFSDGVRRSEGDGQFSESGWSIKWQTLRGGVSDGVETVTLSNDMLSVTVCPTRGMGILRAECDGIPICWTSPVRAPVHPQFVDLQARNKLGWLDGFNELLCRCGLSFNGPPGIDDGARSPIESDLTLHGRIANSPADFVSVAYDEDRGTMSVTGECRESTLFGPHLTLASTVSLHVNGTHIDVDDVVTNHASAPTELQLLYHINVGPPFLEAGARFLTPFREMAPRDDRAAEGVDSFAEYLGPTPGYAEQVYFFDPLPDEEGWATALLQNRSGNFGFSVTYDQSQLPCLSQWKCTQPEADGYVTGIEPATNYPNFKSFERAQDRVIILPAGESYSASLRLAVHMHRAAVAHVAEGIAALQEGVEAVIHQRPAQPFAAP